MSEGTDRHSIDNEATNKAASCLASYLLYSEKDTLVIPVRIDDTEFMVSVEPLNIYNERRQNVEANNTQPSDPTADSL